MNGNDSRSIGEVLPKIRVPALLTFVGLVIGIVAGIALRGSSAEAPVLAITEPVGSLWLNALKMAILPLIAGLLFTGTARAVTSAHAGPMGRRTLEMFALTLVVGAAGSLLAIPALLTAFPIPLEARRALAARSGADLPTAVSASDFLTGIIPENVVMAAANGAMLPLVVFIVLFALAAARLGARHRNALEVLFAALAAAMMVIVGWVLALAPVGVFALSFGMAIASGTAVMATLAHYIAVVSSAGVLVILGAYVVASLAGGQSFLAFARAVLPAQTVAISTQSSLASLPAMIVACRRLGLRDSSAEFVLPLAVALFKATSPAMNFAVAYYVTRMSGVEPNAIAMTGAAGIAVLCSIGIVGVPSAVSFFGGLIPVATVMGAPLEPLAVLIAVEMLPDMVRTLGNVTMNVAVTSVIDRVAGLAPVQT